MSSEEPVRSVPDELFQQVTAKAGRQLPDALFGPPPARPARPEREEPIRSVPDELFKQVTARSTRSLPDALFGPPPAPVTEPAATTEDAGSGDAAPQEAEEPPPPDADTASTDAGPDVAVAESASADDTDAVAVQVDSAVSGAKFASAADSGRVDTTGAPTATGSLDDSGAPGGETGVGTETSSAATNSVPETSAAEAGAIADTAATSTPSTAADAAPAGGVADPGPESGAGVQAIAAAADAVAEDSGSAVDAAAAAVAPAASPEVKADTTPAAAVIAGVGTSADAEADSDSAAADSGDEAQVATTTVAAPAGSVVEHAVPQLESVTAAAEVALVQQEAAARPVESASPRPVLLVIADSLAYFGPKGGLPADDPRIWPNMVAAELDWDVELVARIGWTCRDAYWALIGDPRVWAAVPRAGAVVFAVGGMDTLPSPLPTALREMIRYIRPPRLRRGVRASYNWLQPKLSKLGRPVALPPKVSVDYLEQSREALAQLRPELPVVAVLPSVHKCDAYGRVHRGRARAVKALQAWSGKTSVPLVDLGAAVRDDIESGAANPDGIHWGWAGHAAVATAMTKALQEVR